MVAANPVFAGVAYFNNPVLFDGIIEDDLVIRETFEAGNFASADGQTVFLRYASHRSPELFRFHVSFRSCGARRR